MTEFRDRFVKRLPALARAHSLLVTRSWTDAEIEQVLRSTLEPHLQADPTRFVLDGPAMAISTGAALALSMALHELAANAAKYGALSTLRGRVSIVWRPDPAEAEYVVLNWTESGGPEVAAPRRTGFGMRLLKQAFAAEDGNATLEFFREGARCEMRFRRRRPSDAPSAA